MSGLHKCCDWREPVFVLSVAEIRVHAPFCRWPSPGWAEKAGLPVWRTHWELHQGGGDRASWNNNQLAEEGKERAISLQGHSCRLSNKAVAVFWQNCLSSSVSGMNGQTQSCLSQQSLVFLTAGELVASHTWGSVKMGCFYFPLFFSSSRKISETIFLISLH